MEDPLYSDYCQFKKDKVLYYNKNRYCNKNKFKYFYCKYCDSKFIVSAGTYNNHINGVTHKNNI